MAADRSAVPAIDIAPRAKASNYPALFAERMSGRQKRALGEYFGLTGFGVNLTRLAPGAQSALRHAHSLQDEFVYVLSGTVVLIDDHGETRLTEGMCAGFRAGDGNGHHLVNRSPASVIYLEIGNRVAGDTVSYPDDDLSAAMADDGAWRFLHKDGRPY